MFHSDDVSLEHGHCWLWTGLPCAATVRKGLMPLIIKPTYLFAKCSLNVRYTQLLSSCFSPASNNPFSLLLFPATLPHLSGLFLLVIHSGPKPGSRSGLCLSPPPPLFFFIFANSYRTCKMGTTAVSQSHVKE